MLLQKITLVDFGIYGGCNEFVLASEKNKPIILCGGTNGSGKTTLFESISLCLYGRDSIEPRIPQKQYDQKILRLFHKYPSAKTRTTQASTTLEFQYAHDGSVTEYKIMRMWQNDAGKINETLHVSKKGYRDNNFTPLDSVEQSQWQIFIDHILPKGITKMFFFDGEKIQTIAESGDESGHIKSSFDALLGLDLISQLHDDIGLYLLRESGDDAKKILSDVEQKIAEKSVAEEKLEKLQEKLVFLRSDNERLCKDVAIQERQFLALGGQFAEKRQELMVEKAKLESELDNAEHCIRAICSDTLPLCLVPVQLGQVRDEIECDIQKIQNKFKKVILSKGFADLADELESGLLYDEKMKRSILDKVESIISKKLDAYQEDQSLMFNMSLDDMNSMMHLIDDINESDRKEIEGVALECDSILDALNKTKASLDIAPKQDEIGPLFSAILQANREIGEIEHEMDQLDNLIAQEMSLIALINSSIRKNLTQQKLDNKRVAGLDLAPKVQDVLDEYAKKLRLQKVHMLESNILDGIKRLFHKKNFIARIYIHPETFEITLYRGDGEEITRDMLSQGELQIYSTAIVWGLAKTSERPLPFIIDTPLARLDLEHRQNLVENFYPYASHQTIIFSTDSEIVNRYYSELLPHITRSLVLQYDADSDRTVQHDGYFSQRGDVIEIQ